MTIAETDLAAAHLAIDPDTGLLVTRRTAPPMPALLVNVRRELHRFHPAGTITRLILVGTGCVVAAATPDGETEVVAYEARSDADVAQDAAEWPADEPDRIGYVYARSDADVDQVVAWLRTRLTT